MRTSRSIIVSLQHRPKFSILASAAAPMKDSGSLFAALVQVYRKIDGAWKPMGQAGAAILGGSSTDSRTMTQLVLYEPASKRPFSISNIMVGFQVEVQSTQYVSFVDDQKNRWSIYFATAEQAAVFLQALPVAAVPCCLPASWSQYPGTTRA